MLFGSKSVKKKSFQNLLSKLLNGIESIFSHTMSIEMSRDSFGYESFRNSFLLSHRSQNSHPDYQIRIIFLVADIRSAHYRRIRLTLPLSSLIWTSDSEAHPSASNMTSIWSQYELHIFSDVSYDDFIHFAISVSLLPNSNFVRLWVASSIHSIEPGPLLCDCAIKGAIVNCVIH